MLDAPHQPGLPIVDGGQGDRQHRREGEGSVDEGLLQAPEPEASQHEPLLSTAEQPLDAPPPLEQLHQSLGPSNNEVLPYSEGVSEAGVPPDGDDGLCTVGLRGLPDHSRAVLGVGYYGL